MSSIAWILLGLFIICPHSDSAKPETLCTCQQSGLGPFGPSSHSSHEPGHDTFEHSGSSTETSASNGPFGLGHYVTHAISSAAEHAVSSAADSLLSPFRPDTKEHGSLGNSGSSSHQHVSITYGQEGQSKPLGQLGTTLLGPLDANSGTSQSSESSGTGHYVTYATSSTAQAAEAAETRPSPNGPDGGGPGLLEPGPFGHSGSSSHQHMSITFGQSGQSKALGQGQDISVGAAQTKPSQFESDGGGSVLSESVPFQQSEPSSDKHVTVSVGISGASSNQPGYGLVGPSGSSSIQNGTRLIGPSVESSGSFTPIGSIGSVTFTTSSTSQTAEAAGARPFLNLPDEGEPSPFGTGSFEHSGSSSHNLASVNFGQLGQNKSSELGLGQYNQDINSVVTTVTEAAEKKTSTMGGKLVPSGYGSFSHSEPSSDKHVTVSVGISGATSDQPEREPVTSSVSNSVQHGTRLFGPSEINSETSTSSSDEPGREPFGPSGSSSVQQGAKLLEPSEASSVTSTQSGSIGLGHYVTYTTSSATQTADASGTRPSPNGPNVGRPGSLGPGLLGHPGSHQNVSVAFVQSGQSKSLGLEPGHYIQNNDSIATAAAGAVETKLSQIGPDGGGSVQYGSGIIEQSQPSSDTPVIVSVGLSGASSDQPGYGQIEQPGYGSIQNQTRLSGSSEAGSGTYTSSGSLGSGPYLKYESSSVGQMAKTVETGADKGGQGPFGHSESSSNQHASSSFGQIGQSKSFGGDHGQYNQYGTADTNLSQFVADGGVATTSGSITFEQPGSGSYQQISSSIGQYATSSDQAGHGPVGLLGSSSVQNGSILFEPSEASSGASTSSGSFGNGQYLKYATPSVGQTVEETEIRPSIIGPDTGGPSPFAPGPFGQSGSSLNQHASINFGQSKSFGEGLGQYNQYTNSVAAETKPYQIGSDGGVAVSSGSAAFEQPGSNSYQQISGSVGQYATSSDQPGRVPLGLSGSSSVQNGIVPWEANSGTSTSSGSSGHYLKYATSSIGQTTEEPEIRPIDSDTGGPSLFAPRPIGQSGISSNQHVSITFGQPGKINSLGEGLGQYNQYSNSVAAETKPYQIGSDGVAVPSGSVTFKQPGSNSYQQISGSVGQYTTNLNQPVPVPLGLSGSSSDQNGIRLFGPSEASSETSQSSGSFGSGHYLKYATSPVGQTAEEPEIRPTGADTGGPSPFATEPFGQSGSSSNKNVPITFGQLGQSNSLGEGLGHSNQYSNSVAVESKPYQFGSDGGVAVSSGSVAFGQQEPNSDQPGRGPVGQLGSSSGTSTSSGSLGSGQYFNQATSSVAQTAEETETSPSFIGPDTGGPSPFALGPYGQSGSSSNQDVSMTFGQLGQSKSFGEGLGQYEKYSNSVAAETKPSQFGSDGGVAVSSGSIAFGQSLPSSYQQISGSAGQYTTSSDQLVNVPVGQSGSSTGQNGNRLFGTSTAKETETGSLPIGLDTGRPGILRPGPFGQSGSSTNQHTTVTVGQLGQSKSFGEGLGQYNQYSNSVASDKKPSQFASEGGLAVSSGSVSFKQSGPSSYQQISSSFGPYGTVSARPESTGPLRISSNQGGPGLFGPSGASSGTSTQSGSLGSGHYVSHTTSSIDQMAVSAEPRPYSTGLDGGGLGLIGSGPFGNSGYNSNQPISVTFGHSGQSQSSGQGLGQNIPFSNSVAATAAETEETKPFGFGSNGGGYVPSESVAFGQPGLSSYQYTSRPFGQSEKIKSPEQGPEQYSPSSNSAAKAPTVAAETNPSPYGPYMGALSELGPSGASENSLDQPGHGPYAITGTSSDHSGSGPYLPLGPNTEHFESSQPIGSGPYMQYTSTALTADEAGTEPFVKNGERPAPTGLPSFKPSEYTSYKPVSISFNPYGSSADHPDAGSFGLSNINLDQSAPYKTSEQSTGPSGTSGLLGQGSYMPYTIPSDEAMGTVDQPRPGLFGLSKSSTAINVPSGLFGLGPGFYVPYRNAKGAAMTATAQKEPSPYEPYRGGAFPSVLSAEQPALGFNSPSTPSSYEPSDGQSTVASESSGQLGSGLYKSQTPPEATTVVAVSPVDKKAALKSASKLSSLLTTSRVSMAISFLLPSNKFSPSSLSKVISYLIKSIPESQPGLPGNEMLIQALLEVIASLVHILLSATVGEVGNCPSSSSSLVGQSLTHALGS